MTHVPVLFLIFNRIDTAARVFQRIRAAKPTEIYIAADGPRKGNSEDVEKCERVRQWVLDSIDWNCKVHTLFKEENEGCGNGLADSISWFFQHVKAGIILEDDCLPDISFFAFCEELLGKYAETETVGSICGTNILETWRSPYPYLFSFYGGNWGWATWQRAWILNKGLIYQEDINNPNRYSFLRDLFKNQEQQKALTALFDHVLSDKNPDQHIWDIQWLYTRLYHRTLAITPTKNLVANIGFGEHSTHTKGSNPFSTRTYSYQAPFKETVPLEADLDFDYESGKKYGWIQEKGLHYFLHKIKGSILGKLSLGL